MHLHKHMTTDKTHTHTHSQNVKSPPGWNKTAAASRVEPEGGSISAAEESKMEVAAELSRSVSPAVC